MRIQFYVENQVDVFRITGTLSQSDVNLLRLSLIRHLEKNPPYVSVDLREIHSDEQLNSKTSIQDALKRMSLEIKTLAQANHIEFNMIQADELNPMTSNDLIESALKRKIQTLQEKLRMREEVHLLHQALQQENQELRIRLKQEQTRNDEENPLSEGVRPLVEKLWSEGR